MNNLQLAITFPEAKSTLERLIREDKQRIKEYNDKQQEVKDLLLKNPKYIAHLERHLYFIMWGYRYIKEGCEPRLKKNKEILNFIKRNKNSSGLQDWQAKVDLAKAFPVNQLIKFNRQGKALCIFHNERTPSLKYYKKDNRVHCFGCNRSEDSIGVVQYQLNYSFKDAVKWLASNN